MSVKELCAFLCCGVSHPLHIIPCFEWYCIVSLLTVIVAIEAILVEAAVPSFASEIGVVAHSIIDRRAGCSNTIIRLWIARVVVYLARNWCYECRSYVWTY